MSSERSVRNIPSISKKQQQMLKKSHVCIVGCGGLGGYALEYLTRIGTGHLTVIDGDTFECTNLNRQLLCTQDLLGFPKAQAAAERIREISTDTEVCVKQVFLDETNAQSLLQGADIVLDALDSASDRLILAKACREQGIPLVHGAVQGWIAQIAVLFPESRIMEQLYGATEPLKEKSCLSFTPALCAAVQCAEAVKILTGQEPSLRGRLLTVDLQSMEVVSIELL